MPKNARPISSLPTISRILERIIQKSQFEKFRAIWLSHPLELLKKSEEKDCTLIASLDVAKDGLVYEMTQLGILQNDVLLSKYAKF